MTEATAKTILEGLKEAGINFVASLPELQLTPLIEMVDADPDITHVGVTKEDEGIGVCAGAYLCGKRTAMILMNTGFLLSGNAFAQLNYLYGIPNLLLIGYTGGPGEPFWVHSVQSRFTEPVLRAMRIPYEIAAKVSEVKNIIMDAETLAESSKLPTAVLLLKQALRG